MKSPTRFAALVAFLASFLLSSAVAHAQGWVPTPRGGGGGGGGGGGITCPTGDLGTGCYVQSLSGNNNAGGAIPLSSGAYITAASGSNSYIDLTGANASYGYAKFLNYVQTPEVIAPGTLSIGLNGTAGELTLDTTTNAGYTTIKTPTGTNLYFEAQLGAGIEYHVADAGIYFVSTGIYLDGVLQIQNPGNGNPVWTWSANDTALATQTAAASTAGLQIGQATQNSATVPANFVVKPQWQSGTDEGSAAANTPASFVVNYGAPYTASNAGSEAGFIVERNGVFFGSIQGWTGAPTAYGTLYLGPGITPAGTNYTILSDGTSNTYFNSPGSSGQIHFQIANTDYYEMAKTYFAPATDNAYANGTNGARWQYISTGPTGFLVYHAQGDATAIARMYDNGGVPSLLFGAAGSSPLISQSTQTSDIAPNDLTIQSQGPFASASTHKSPGNLVFNTPAPVSGGNTGYSYFETGGTKIAAFGTYNNGTSTGTLYLGSPAAAPSLSNWSIYNNGSGATVFNATSVIYFDIASTGYLQLALTPSTMFGPVSDLGVNNGLTTNRWGEVIAGSNGFQVYSGTSGSASANPTSQLGSASLTMGIGSSAADLRLERAGGSVAYLDNNAGGNAYFYVGGGTTGSQVEIASGTTAIDVTSGSAQKSLNLGTTNATSLVEGNQANTATITNAMTSGGGATWTFGGTTYLNANTTGLYPGSTAIDLGIGGDPWGPFYTTTVQIQTLSNDPTLEFLSGSAAGGTYNAFIGFTAANTVGQGMALAMIGQTAKSGSGAQGGAAAIASGAGDTGQSDGGIVFGYNASTLTTSIPDNVTLEGAATSSARGNMEWSSTITPQLTQASRAVHNGNATDWTIAPEQNTDSTSTSGRSGALLVNLSAPPNTSTVESYLDVQRALVDTISLGPYPGAPTAGGVWLSTSYAGANESSSNFALYGDSTQTIVNSPSKTQFRIGNTSVTNLQTSGWGGDASTHNFKWNPTTVSVGVGGTTTISAATLATAPFITLSDTGTTTSQIVLDFSNSGNQQGSFWIVDTFGIAFGSSLGISVKYGSTTEVVTSNGAPAGNMFTVALDGSANRILWH